MFRQNVICRGFVIAMLICALCLFSLTGCTPDIGETTPNTTPTQGNQLPTTDNTKLGEWT